MGDYSSLCQFPRSRAEEQGFRRALGDLDVLYANDFSLVLKVESVPDSAENRTPYATRGWCSFETRTAGTKARSARTYSTAGIHSLALCPCLPEDFKKVLESKHFTNGTDSRLVVELYTKLFNDKVKAMREFRVVRLENNESLNLARVIPCCRGLQQIVFIECTETLTREGMRPIEL